MVVDNVKFGVLGAGVALLFWSPMNLHAELGDPTIETDHPVYSGEGAFQYPEQIVKRVTKGLASDQKRAIALYKWLLQHQFHCQQPVEWARGPKVPDSRDQKDELMYVRESNRTRFSFGFAMCGSAHAWNQVLWRAAGFNSRNRAFPGHTNSEIEYGGSWHAFDTDMSGLILRHDGIVAGYEDVAKDLSILKNTNPNLPCYPFGAGKKLMMKSWHAVARKLKQNPKSWFKLYNVGYESMPPVVRLRSGEIFTRWFDPDHFGGKAQRRYWLNRPGGPCRDWTFVNLDDVGGQARPIGNASYCNAEFVYTPKLSNESYREGVVSERNVAFGPVLKSTDGKEAEVIFEHISPYIIAGAAVQGGLVQTGKAVGGLVIDGEASGGAVKAAVSFDDGLRWHDLGILKGTFNVDATDFVKGRWAWQVRFQCSGTAGLKALKFTTVCQASQTIYPRLKAGGCEVTFRSSNQGLARTEPFFFGTEEQAKRNEVATLRKGVQWKGATATQREAFRYEGGGAAALVYRLSARAPLTGLSGSFNYTVLDNPYTPKELAHTLLISIDEGKTWKQIAKAEYNADNEYSSGWLYGKTALEKGAGKEALFKLGIDCGPHPTAICRVELFGRYQTKPAREVKVTYGWLEGGTEKTHREPIPAGAAEKKFNVSTGAEIKDSFIRMEVP